jgi:hypothetical protein
MMLYRAQRVALNISASCGNSRPPFERLVGGLLEESGCAHALSDSDRVA